MKRIDELVVQMKIHSEITNFDNAALSYMPRPVQKAISRYNMNRNLKGPEYDRYWESAERARALCAKKIGASPDEMFFIQNTSMGINFVAKAIGLQRGDNIIISDVEFPSNVYPWMNLEREGVEVRFAKNCRGNIEVKEIAALIDENTRAVSVSWVVASNGSVTDLYEFGRLCREKGILYIVDGIQGIGQIPVDVKLIGCDFFISGFFKWLMGPDGVGFVYINPEKLKILSYPWLGWAGMRDKFNYSEYVICPADSARRYETGNLNFSALAGVEACLGFTDGWEEEIYDRVCSLTSYLRDRLSEREEIRVLSTCERLSGITLFTSDNLEDIVNALWKAGFKFSVRGGIRVSLHFYNNYEQIDQFIKVLDMVG